jgi:hypothetical protein
MRLREARIEPVDEAALSGEQWAALDAVGERRPVLNIFRS